MKAVIRKPITGGIGQIIASNPDQARHLADWLASKAQLDVEACHRRQLGGLAPPVGANFTVAPGLVLSETSLGPSKLKPRPATRAGHWELGYSPFFRGRDQSRV
jgi:hypothetical protein